MRIPAVLTVAVAAMLIGPSAMAQAAGEVVPDSNPVTKGMPYSGSRVVKSGAAIVMLRQPQNPNETSEILGPEYINGVYAEGSRSTESVPPGKSGNGTGHPVRRIDEIWMAPDLQMPVKTFLDDGRARQSQSS